MEIKIIILLCCFGFIVACDSKGNVENVKETKNPIDKSEELSSGTLVKKDTIVTNSLLGSSYYSFHFISEDKYNICWGTDKFNNCSDSLYRTLGNGNLSLIASDKEYIILGQSTGSGIANIRTILPLNENTHEIQYDNILFENLTKTVLLKADMESDKFKLINFKTEKEIIFEIKDFCPAIEPCGCIDSVKLKENTLYIHYQGKKWTVDKKDNRIKTIKIP